MSDRLDSVEEINKNDDVELEVEGMGNELVRKTGLDSVEQDDGILNQSGEKPGQDSIGE